ncbi:hypothetical protein [Algoriphagus litoralis]|uniref:hypothetical protein n=1 Tax=Algoriphagus litoralis TaxID=2202829 RepID=UPI000DB958CF|nr:hypothetical protein [Algoriphagus litoralis]
MKKISVIGIAILAVFFLGYFAFDRLGGNNPIQVELVDGPPPSLVGRSFTGQPQDEELVKIFKSIETLQSLHPGKKIHTIYYQEPAGKLDTMKVFVGLDLPFAPAEMESKTFIERKYLLATITGNQWVMPGPNKVKSKLEESAEELNVSLSGIFIDRIVSDTMVQVIAPIR